MANSPVVQHDQSFQYLRRDNSCCSLRLDRMLFDEFTQITVPDVLHREVDRITVFKPSEKQDK